MKKNKILSVILVGLCAFASVLMFACGGGESAPTSAEKLPEIIQTMDANDDLFKTGTIDGISTNFRIEPLNSINLQYNRCFVIAMNYINKYKADVSLLKDASLNGQTAEAVSKLEQNLTYMLESYNKLVAEQDRLENFDKGVIYIGALQQFKVIATEFIDYTYQVAFALGEIERYHVVNFDSLEAEQLTMATSEALKDYLSLQVGYDCFKVLIKSCNSIDYTTKLSYLINYCTSVLSSFTSGYVASTNYKLIDNETLKELLDLEKKMQVERNVLDEIFNKFSLYTFVENYDADIEKLGADIEYAKQYYSRIQTYYEMLSKYATNLRTTLLN